MSENSSEAHLRGIVACIREGDHFDIDEFILPLTAYIDERVALAREELLKALEADGAKAAKPGPELNEAGEAADESDSRQAETASSPTEARLLKRASK